MATKRKPGQKSTTDKLTKTSKKQEIELKEEDLKRVSGGSMGIHIKAC